MILYRVENPTITLTKDWPTSIETILWFMPAILIFLIFY